MRLGEFRFEPTLLPTLAMIVLLTLFMSLGFWQLSRAGEKRDLIGMFESRMNAAALTAPEIGEGVDIDALRYRHVRFQGAYLPARQFLLDNRVHDRRAGFEVLTPFRLTDGRVVLVNRGWVPLGASRDELPEVGIAGAATVIEGWLYAPFEKAYSLGGMDDATAGWPRIVQYLDFDQMGARLGAPLLPVTVRLSESATAGYVRDWSVVPMTPAKHIAYAVQWFGLALAVLVLYLVLNVKRRSGHE